MRHKRECGVRVGCEAREEHEHGGKKVDVEHVECAWIRNWEERVGENEDEIEWRNWIKKFKEENEDEIEWRNWTKKFKEENEKN